MPVTAAINWVTVLSIIGTLGGFVMAGVGIWMTAKHRQEKDAQTLLDKSIIAQIAKQLAPVLDTVAQTEQTARTSVSALGELRDRHDGLLRQLRSDVNDARNKCVRHQADSLAGSINDLKAQAQRLDDKLSALQQKLQDHQNDASDRYVTMQIYQNDKQFSTSQFAVIQQNVSVVLHLLGNSRNRRGV